MTNNLTNYQLYLKEVAKYDVLTPEDEAYYALSYKESKNEYARQMLIHSNLRLVIDIATDFCYGNTDLMDLIEAGNEGLLKAVEKYDYEKGFRFSTYATTWISQGIRRYLADNALVHLPEYVVITVRKVNKIKAEMETKLGRKIKDEELRKVLDQDEYEKYLFYTHTYLSFDAPLTDDNKYTLADTIKDNENLSEKLNINEEKERITSAMLASLKPREAEMIKLRYGMDNEEEHTLEEIGTMFSLSKERVRQVLTSAIRKLKLNLQHDEAFIEYV